MSDFFNLPDFPSIDIPVTIFENRLDNLSWVLELQLDANDYFLYSNHDDFMTWVLDEICPNLTTEHTKILIYCWGYIDCLEKYSHIIESVL
jgi:hypothetical protein